ncbi:XrtA/PEP-CTERM system TPR-repeat protein PrsT [Janthinobacterium sp.]|uniref:XrtA/PEP-CTERM system TPR-repeat protein PrsT n=1 Tax=Janthinobacterium sp. TaxID=1871054 RepID=UPI00293D6ECD|nr:XrtA/PEP-CTERM system TPR-repeat protein PrsT [Janthinobacterium sp.]
MPHSPIASTTLARGLLCATVLLGALSGCHRTPDGDGLLAEARQYRERGELKAAVIQLKNVLQQAPGDAAARLLLGQIYIEAGDPLSAEKELRKAQSLGLPPAQLLPSLGRAMLMLGQNDKLLAEFALDPSKPAQLDLMALRANAYLASGAAGQARELFEQMLSAQADSSDALQGLARLAVAANQADKAAELVVLALRKSPSDIDALRLHGDILRMQGKSADARLLYLRILALRPESTYAHVDIANLDIQDGQFAAARREIDAAAKNAPNSLIVLHAQALLDAREGRNQGALDALQLILRAAPDHMPSILLIGAVHLAMGASPQAEQYLRRFLAANPRHPYASKMLATLALQNGQAERAIELVAPALLNNPNDIELLSLNGEAQIRAGRFAKAAEYFEKASALAPGTAALHTSLGLSRLGMGENARAIGELERAAALSGKEPRAGVLLVMTLLRDKQYDRALAAVQALTQQLPANPLVHNLQGGVYLARTDAVAARASFEKALRIDPAYLPALENLAQLDIAEKKPEAARLRFEAALAKEPKSAALMTALAKLAASQNKPAEIRRWLERASAENPGAVPPAVALGNFYLQAGETKKALALALALQSSHPDDAAPLALRALAELTLGERTAALASYNKLAILQPGSADLQMRIGAIHMALKNSDAALQSVRRAHALQPDMLEAQVTEVALLLLKGKQGEALKLARAVQKEHPELPAGFKMEGDILMVQNQAPAALKLYERAFGIKPIAPLLIQIHRALILAGRGSEAGARMDSWLRAHPSDSSTRLYLAGTSLQAKDYKAAIAQFEKLLQQDPKNVVALNDLAWAYQQEKDKRALPTAELAFREQASNPAVLDTLGWILIEQGGAARALPLLQKAVALAPESVVTRYHLGVALVKSGDKKGARSQLQQLLAENKEFPERTEAQALLSTL